MAEMKLSQPLTFRLPYDLIDRLKALATADKRTLSAYVRIKLEELAPAPKGRK